MTQKETTQLSERVAVIETKLDSIEKKMDDFIESADKKYASKNVEKVVYGMIGIVLASVLYYLLEHLGIK